MMIMLMNAIELACISGGLLSTPATNPIACPPQQMPIRITKKAVMRKDALGSSNKNAKQIAVVKPLMKSGNFRALNLSEIQPKIGELNAQVKLSRATKMAACPLEK